MPREVIQAHLRLNNRQFMTAMQRTQQRMMAFQQSVQKAAVVMRRLFVAGALAMGAKSLLEFQDKLHKASIRTGLTVEELNGLELQAKLAAVEFEKLTIQLDYFAKQLKDAQRGSGQGILAFREYGIAILNAEGNARSVRDVLHEVADVMQGMTNATERNAMAQRLFSSTGAASVAWLQEGSEGLRAYQQEAMKFRHITTESANAAVQFNDTVTRLGTAIQGVGLQALRPWVKLFERWATVRKDLTGQEEETWVETISASLAKMVVLLETVGEQIAEIAGAIASSVKLLIELPMTQWDQAMRPLEAMWERMKAFHIRLETNLKASGLIMRKLYDAEGNLVGTQKYGEKGGVTLGTSRSLPPPKKFNAADFSADHTKVLRIMKERLEVEGRIVEAKRLQVGILELEGLAAARALEIKKRDPAITVGASDLEETIATIDLKQAKMQALNLELSNDWVAKWQNAMQRWVTDSENNFGLFQTLAQNVATNIQGMFERHFFDMFEGRMRTLQDVLNSFANFAKTVISNVLAQIATQRVMGFLANMGLSLGGAGGGGTATASPTWNLGGVVRQNWKGFSAGGYVQGAGLHDTIPAMLSAGEGVLSRKGMHALAKLNSGVGLGAPQTNVTVINETQGQAQVQRSRNDSGGEDVIVRIIEQDLMKGGKTFRAINNMTGLTYQPTAR